MSKKKKEKKKKTGDVGLGTDVNEKKEKERSGQITYNKDLCEHKLWTQPWD